MLNSDLLKNRLSQYGVAWLLAFALGLLVTLAGPPLLGMRLVQVADLYLPVAFIVLGLLLLAGLVMGLMSRETFPVKLALLGLALVLALPLFWAPVLGVVLSAAVTQVSIEYSEAYAGFRILVGNLLFNSVQVLFAGAVWDTIWRGFQVLSTIVGFLVGLHQLLGIAGKMFGPRRIEPEAG